MENTSRLLPHPIPMVTPLTEVLAKRRSRREFAAKNLDDAVLSTLLWACAGLTEDSGKRTVPSAMDCREIVVFVFDAKGVWLYEAQKNALTLVGEGDVRGSTTLGQDFVKTAPVTLVFANDETHCEKIVGSRKEKCLAVDAGCMVEAGQLACAALGLASVARASFDVSFVASLLGDAKRYTPVMALTVGYPA